MKRMKIDISKVQSGKALNIGKGRFGGLYLDNKSRNWEVTAFPDTGEVSCFDNYNKAGIYDTANSPLPYGYKGHKGLDLRASEGTPIIVDIDGWTPMDTGTTSNGSNYVRFKWQGGIVTLHHLKSKVTIKKYHKGEILALTGKSGTSAPHLHIEVLADYIDPLSISEQF